MTKHIMFTYGTLKRGYGNNERCLAGAKFLGKAVSVEANFMMKHIGFPILWQGSSPAKVAGEIFEINDDQLARCDRLEGHPRMYKREEREFTYTTQDDPAQIVKITAWVYLWNQRPNGDEVPLVNGVYDWDPSKIVYPEEDDDMFDGDEEEAIGE